MNIDILVKTPAKYYCIPYKGNDELMINEHCDALLRFIGHYYLYDADHDRYKCKKALKNNTLRPDSEADIVAKEYSSAYRAIKATVNQNYLKNYAKILHVKTSSREIRAVRASLKGLSRNGDGRYTVHIPYKVDFIFKAIIDLLKDIPEEYPWNFGLDRLEGNTIRAAFYRNEISMFLASLEDGHEPTAAVLSLRDDLVGEANTFQEIFH